MGLGQKFLTQVGSGQFFVARVWSGLVSYLWFGFEFGKFPPKKSNFSIFFPSGQKVSGSTSNLLQVKNKLGAGQGPSLRPSVAKILKK